MAVRISGLREVDRAFRQMDKDAAKALRVAMVDAARPVAATAKDLLGEGSKRFEGFLKRGSSVVGDVHREVSEVAGAITPVPGGIGPLTIAMLMANTLRAAELRLVRGR